MRFVASITGVCLMLGVLTSASSALSQIMPRTPWMFYPQDQKFFYTNFCRKYRCIENTNQSQKSRGIEEYGIGDTRYAGFVNVEAIRSLIGTNKKWVMGIDVRFNLEMRYDKSILDPGKNFLHPDFYEFLNNLSQEAIGKKYTKQLFIKCLSVNKRSVDRIYYLDEFLRFPSTAPITKVSSGQGVPLYVKVYCSLDYAFSIELSP